MGPGHGAAAVAVRCAGNESAEEARLPPRCQAWRVALLLDPRAAPPQQTVLHRRPAKNGGA